MSRTPSDLTTHLVRWTEPKAAFDNKTFFPAEHRGIVLTQVYDPVRGFLCLIADANGKTWVKDATQVAMVYPPISHPRNGHNTEPTQIKQNTQ